MIADRKGIAIHCSQLIGLSLFRFVERCSSVASILQCPFSPLYSLTFLFVFFVPACDLSNTETIRGSLIYRFPFTVVAVSLSPNLKWPPPFFFFIFIPPFSLKIHPCTPHPLFRKIRQPSFFCSRLCSPFSPPINFVFSIENAAAETGVNFCGFGKRVFLMGEKNKIFL